MNHKTQDGQAATPTRGPGGTTGSASSRQPSARRDPPSIAPAEGKTSYTDRERDPQGPRCPTCPETLLKVPRFETLDNGRIHDHDPPAPFYCLNEARFYTRRGKEIETSWRDLERQRREEEEGARRR